MHEVVYLIGIWDLFHIGHLNIIRRASKLGDKLVVGVATDEFAAGHKEWPTIPFEQRYAIISAIRYVDAVEPVECFEDMHPMIKHGVTICVAGGDFGQYAGQSVLLRKTYEMGIKFVLLPRTPGVSTTLIKQKVRRDNAD